MIKGVILSLFGYSESETLLRRCFCIDITHTLILAVVIYVIHLRLLGTECIFATRDAAVDQVDKEKGRKANPSKKEAGGVLYKRKIHANNPPRWIAFLVYPQRIVGIYIEVGLIIFYEH